MQQSDVLTWVGNLLELAQAFDDADCPRGHGPETKARHSLLGVVRVAGRGNGVGVKWAELWELGAVQQGKLDVAV